MAVWCTIFSNLKRAKRPLLSAAGSHTRLDGHCPLRTYHGIFQRAEKNLEDTNSRIFLMKKGFRLNKVKPNSDDTIAYVSRIGLLRQTDFFYS
jgi:hypothetical protein